MDYGVITFTSTYGAIYAQKVLRPAADVLTMPVLREISLGCGIAVRFQPEDLDAVRAALAASTLKPDEYAFYGVTGSGSALRAGRVPGEFGGTAPMAARPGAAPPARAQKIQPSRTERAKAAMAGRKFSHRVG